MQKQHPETKQTNNQNLAPDRVPNPSFSEGMGAGPVSGRLKRELNSLSEMMRYYLLYTMTHREPKELNREIKCEGCEVYEGLEMHHEKYYPKETVTVDDIHLSCNKCHRNDDNPQSRVKTVFENGKRFCVASKFKFEY